MSTAFPIAPIDPQQLAVGWERLREKEPGIRVRDAAWRLGVSEMELMATGVGQNVRRLRCDVNEMLPRLEELGEVMALTRNEVFVQEKMGVYENVELGAHSLSVAGPDIDLRIFPSSWTHAFAVTVSSRRGPMESLQFFDAHGVAVHKIYLRDGSDRAAFGRFVEDFLSEDQSVGATAEPSSDAPVLRADEEVDVEALVHAWEAMRDTHEFFGLLRQHRVGRTQAFRLVPDELARRVDNTAIGGLLDAASEDQIEIMVFVQSPGTIQIHHGPVHRIVPTDDWLNVMDPRFNLHVQTDLIHETWVVRKPTEAGWVTSVEFFDAAGRTAALMFGCRTEGEPENSAWRGLAEGLA